MKITQTHSWTDMNSGLPLQLNINKWFYFLHYGVARCNKHNIPRCQCCTDSAIKNCYVEKPYES